jgi:hypothetical protein
MYGQLNKNMYINIHKLLLILTLINGISSVHAKDWIYRVEEGDNLWDITSDYLIDSSFVTRVQILNNIVNPMHLQQGMKIRIPEKWIRQFPSLLQVKNLRGTAEIIEESDDKPKQLQAGAIVIQGDTVVTGEDSSLVLVFLDGTKILLQENSRLKIDHLSVFENTGLSDSQLSLEAGRMETQVIPSKSELRRFKIQTRATVTSVRGTDYRVSAEQDKDESRTEVIEGKVDVKGIKLSSSITTGFGTVSVKGQEPMPPVKLLPAPDVSQIPKTFDQVPIQFTMPTLEQGQGYRVQIAKTSKFQDLLFDKRVDSSTIRGSDLPDGGYYIRVRGIDAQQLEGLNAQFEFSINARPESPFLSSPNSGQGFLIDESAEFSWAKQKNVKNYHFQIAKDQNFDNLLVDRQDVDQSEFSIDEKMKVGKYFWRVAATDQEGDGPFSEGQMFRRIKPAPDIEAPDISDDSLVIRSQSGLPSQTYHFQIAEDESFSELLVDKHMKEPRLEIPRPSGGEYYIRIRTIDSDGFVGPFSKPQSISVPYDYYWLLTLLPLLVLIAL